MSRLTEYAQRNLVGLSPEVKSLDYLEACALDLADYVTDGEPTLVRNLLHDAIQHHINVVREALLTPPPPEPLPARG